METPNTLSEQRSTRRPWRRKYRAASQGNSPIRVLNVWITSSAPEGTYNRAGWHDPSEHSSAVPTPALAKLRNQYYAYIITLWKYHGHRGRGTITARPKHGLNRTRGCRFFYFSLTFRTLLFGRPVRQHNRRTHDATAREAASYVGCPGGLYNELNTCLT